MMKNPAPPWSEDFEPWQRPTGDYYCYTCGKMFMHTYIVDANPPLCEECHTPVVWLRPNEIDAWDRPDIDWQPDGEYYGFVPKRPEAPNGNTV